MYEYPLVVVRWADAIDRGDGDGVRGPHHEPSIQVCTGWQLKYNKRGITIAFEYTEGSHDWRNETFIPAGMILGVDEIDFT